MLRCILGILLAVQLAACSKPPTSIEIVDLGLPVAGESLAPRFAMSPAGSVYLSWIETNGSSSRLVFSRLMNESWSQPKVIAAGANWFVNWADFPALAVLDENRLLAHWLVRSGPDSYAYDIHVGRSMDAGQTWTDLGVIHDDATPTEHGFVSFYPYLDEAGERQAGLVWLDGRHMNTGSARPHGSVHPGMSLRHARLDSEGHISERVQLDGLTCDCCQTAAVAVNDDVIVAYRDRSDQDDGTEIRDIRLTGRVSGQWLDLGLVNPDGWQIDGCPVNGPSMASRGGQLAIAWFTAAAGRPAIKLGMSPDAGTSFQIRDVSDAAPLGRVATVLLADEVVVSWLAHDSAGAEIRLQRFDFAAMPLTKAQRVVGTDSARASGFPQLLSADDDLLLAWTDVAGQSSRVRVARLLLKPR